ncbi:hypothetical protein SH203_01042 [Brevundimonas sp. SH203]|uniref:putative hemolysin n=1 Tax=Brevundimonas sp. SH203 TaxID=345167 RepID=UPI0009CC03DF|nr:DUF333 domain-containing protein [Brevundimonas sp. SH203]GAW40642.1 hypothetical protein SH203_01042 [Brevundimonas sp. SH203]
MIKLALSVALPLAALAACAQPAQPTPKPIGMPNPASKYCVDSGGRLEIVTGADGGQSGMCHLPDGRVIEEWALFRSAHPRS